MNIHKTIINNFSRISEHYDEAAVIQQTVAQRMIQRLSFTKIRPHTILDLGCGSASYLETLKKSYPDANYIGIDLNLTLLKKLHSRQPESKFVCTDTYQLPIASHSIDLIFANFLFPWITDLSKLLTECCRVLKPGGVLQFSALGPDSFYELRHSWFSTDAETNAMDFIDMHHIGDLLLQVNLSDPVMDREYLTSAFKDFSSLFKELRHQGLRNLHPQRAKHLFGKKRYEDFLTYYQQNFLLEDGIIPMTYEVIYGQAWAPKTALMKDNIVNIPLRNIQRPEKNK